MSAVFEKYQWNYKVLKEPIPSSEGEIMELEKKTIRSWKPLLGGGVRESPDEFTQHAHLFEKYQMANRCIKGSLIDVIASQSLPLRFPKLRHQKPRRLRDGPLVPIDPIKVLKPEEPDYRATSTPPCFFDFCEYFLRALRRRSFLIGLEI